MTLKLVWGHLADYATLGANGKPTLVGIFEQVIVMGPGPTFQLPLCHFVAKIEGSIVDGAEHTVSLRLLDGNSQPLMQEPALFAAVLAAAGPGYPLSVTLLIQMSGLPIPGLGDYDIEVGIVGIGPLGTVPIVVVAGNQ